MEKKRKKQEKEKSNKSFQEKEMKWKRIRATVDFSFAALKARSQSIYSLKEKNPIISHLTEINLYPSSWELFCISKEHL